MLTHPLDGCFDFSLSAPPAKCCEKSPANKLLPKIDPFTAYIIQNSASSTNPDGNDDKP